MSQSPAPIDMEKRVEQFVRLRDIIREKDEAHKTEMRPYRDALEGLSSLLLDHLNTVNIDTARTPAGTVYRTSRKSASVADMEAFWTFVITQGKFDLLDKKANVTAVEDYINEQIEAAQADPKITPGPPPGVNFTVRTEIGVRRPNNRE